MAGASAYGVTGSGGGADPGSRTKGLTLRVDRASDAVVDLVVQLGEHVLGVDRGLRHVADGGRLDNVGNLEPLDGLVL